MKILCIKCSYKHMKYLRMENELIYLADEWDRKNVDFISEKSLFKKVIFAKNLDSIEELENTYSDLLQEIDSIENVICGAEYGIYAHGYLKSRIKKNPKYLTIAIQSRNKKAMKQLFNNVGINCANIYGSFEKDELVNESRNFKYPIVVKPISGTGSFNTSIIRDRKNLLEYACNLTFHDAIEDCKLVVEEYIEGDEYHVDTIIQGGYIKFMSIGKYYTPRINTIKKKFRHLNGSYILPLTTNEPLYRKISNIQEDIAEILCFNNGVMHSEFFLKDDEIYFSEIATRFAGNQIPAMIKNSYAVDIEEEWLNIELGKNIRCYCNSENFRIYTGTIDIVPKQPGIIKYIPPYEQVKNEFWIKKVINKKKIGDKFHFSHPSERCLLIVFEAESERELLKRVYSLNRNYEIEIEERRR